VEAVSLILRNISSEYQMFKPYDIYLFVVSLENIVDYLSHGDETQDNFFQSLDNILSSSSSESLWLSQQQNLTSER
jgi:hypothetical protein